MKNKNADNLDAMEIDGEIITAIAKAGRLDLNLKTIGVEQELTDLLGEVIGHLYSISTLHRSNRQPDNELNITVKLEYGDEFNPILKHILTKVDNMLKILEQLTAQVAADKTVGESAITLLQGLKAKLDEAIASGNESALQALSDSLGANTQALADAITANTPATPA